MKEICSTQSTTDPVQQHGQQKHCAGIRRTPYFGAMLGLAVLEGWCGAVAKDEPRVAFLGLRVILILSLALVVSRFLLEDTASRTRGSCQVTCRGNSSLAALDADFLGCRSIGLGQVAC